MTTWITGVQCYINTYMSLLCTSHLGELNIFDINWRCAWDVQVRNIFKDGHSMCVVLRRYIIAHFSRQYIIKYIDIWRTLGVRSRTPIYSTSPPYHRREYVPSLYQIPMYHNRKYFINHTERALFNTSLESCVWHRIPTKCYLGSATQVHKFNYCHTSLLKSTYIPRLSSKYY